MTHALLWAGGVCGALIAIGTLLRFVLRRTVATVAWISQVSALPQTVNDLTANVTTLAGVVDQLAQDVRDQRTASIPWST